MNNREKRKKAFIGAIIGAASSLIGTGINAIQNKKAAKKQAEYEEEQRKKEQTNLNQEASIQQAQAMTQSLNNQEYVNEYKNKITFKNGGKMKTNKYDDRIKRVKRYACGGKRKALLGTTDAETNNKIKTDATNAAISGTANIISSIIDKPIVQKPVNPVIKPTEFTTSVKTGLKQPNYANNTNANINNNQYMDRLEQAKCGTKKKIKR